MIIIFADFQNSSELKAMSVELSFKFISVLQRYDRVFGYMRFHTGNVLVTRLTGKFARFISGQNVNFTIVDSILERLQSSYLIFIKVLILYDPSSLIEGNNMI